MSENKGKTDFLNIRAGKELDIERGTIPVNLGIKCFFRPFTSGKAHFGCDWYKAQAGVS